MICSNLTRRLRTADKSRHSGKPISMDLGASHPDLFTTLLAKLPYHPISAVRPGPKGRVQPSWVSIDSKCIIFLAPTINGFTIERS
jgi:hypothetical protein